uniref:PDZ domain-containing protein n=1 Tax=Hyaloperonospora arabidopsidis (strain Emoy2) TaxID=559515 RepID=M4B5R6_HYAAE
MFPWLRSNPGGALQLSGSDKIDSTNGLFFQQLYAFALVGKRVPVSAAQYKRKQAQDAFLSLVHTYVTGNYDQENGSRRPQTMNSAGHGRYSTPAHGTGGRSTSASATYAAVSRESRNTGGRRMTVPSSPVYPPEHDPSGFSDSGSDSSVEDLSAYPTRSSLTNGYGGPHRLRAPSSPSQATATLSPALSSAQSTMEGIENVFDIVFKQQAIGMKLGADESKQYAVVKECFDGSEAKRYPEIQNGVVILAVNGQEVGGLGLSRVLYRLREAPRPVVVRFGRMSTHQLRERRKGRGLW